MFQARLKPLGGRWHAERLQPPPTRPEPVLDQYVSAFDEYVNAGFEIELARTELDLVRAGARREFEDSAQRPALVQRAPEFAADPAFRAVCGRPLECPGLIGYVHRTGEGWVLRHALGYGQADTNGAFRTGLYKTKRQPRRPLPEGI